LGGGRRAAFHEHDEEYDGGGEAEDPAEVIEGFFAGAGVVVAGAGAAVGSVVSHVVGVVDALVVGFHGFVVVGPSGAFAPVLDVGVFQSSMLMILMVDADDASVSIASAAAA